MRLCCLAYVEAGTFVRIEFGRGIGRNLLVDLDPELLGAELLLLAAREIQDGQEFKRFSGGARLTLAQNLGDVAPWVEVWYHLLCALASLV